MSVKAAPLAAKSGEAVKTSPTTEHNRKLLEEAMQNGVEGGKIWQEQGLGSNINVYL